MDWLRIPRRRVVLATVVAVLVAFGWWMARGGRDDAKAEWVRVNRDDLVLAVELEGTLAAVDTSSLTPPQIPGMWDYKISFMAQEGDDVEQGTPILGFDTSELQRRLQEEMAEAEAANKEIEKKEAELALSRQNDELRLAEAEARKRRASLKVEVPGEFSSSNELLTARLDLELANHEITFLGRKLDAMRRSGESSLQALRKQKARAEAKVREIRDAIERMNVKAPRDGTVIYATNWQGEKKKVGDSCWQGENVMEIPDLSNMRAKGEVDEADAARVTVGQTVTFNLDAHPDEDFKGQVAFIWSTVQRKSWRIPLKIVRLDIELHETDERRMRPGMRFRGAIETERIENALVVPKDTIFLSEDGTTMVYRKSLFGVRTVPVVLGKRNDTLVEVIEGLEDGDRVSRVEISGEQRRTA